MTNDSETALRVTHNPHLAQDWVLVLTAQGLSPNVRRTQAGFVISVPEEEWESAVASLSEYEKENPPKTQEPNQWPEAPDFVMGVAVAATLLAFHLISVRWSGDVPWFDAGSADASKIVRGEIWRTVTALTLHADIAHALGNAAAAAIFLSALSSLLGAGLTSVLVLVAGAAGNLANAYLHASPHVSIGASTAVFAAVGLLGAIGMARRRRMLARRRPGVWVPIAAALALLALLGTGGERVDVLAHLSGFMFGAILGGLIALVAPHPPGLRVQWACGGAAAALLIYCWMVALG